MDSRHLRELGVNGKIILECNLNKKFISWYVGLIWLITGPRSRLFLIW
jgi:hypothetical protein